MDQSKLLVFISNVHYDHYYLLLHLEKLIPFLFIQRTGQPKGVGKFFIKVGNIR